MPTWLVTGGAGFIGGNFVLEAVADGVRIVNLDALTYAGNLRHAGVAATAIPDHVFVHGDIGDRALVARLLAEHRPDAVVNFAAESHVDRSIDGPGAFVQTNVVGTLALLEAARDYWKSLRRRGERDAFRFLHVSTDEVYGSLGDTGKFTETTPYAPNSPYSASKAASDHLVRAFHHTYGLPVLTTNCSNNYGPYQFPEKLIPLMIAQGARRRAAAGLRRRQERARLAVRRRPLRGDPRACSNAAASARPTTSAATPNARTSKWSRRICALLDERRPREDGKPREVADHLRHRSPRPRSPLRDRCLQAASANWAGRPRTRFEQGIAETVDWYLDNQAWVQRVLDGSYRLERIGSRGMTQRRNARASSWPAAPARACIRSPRRSASSCCRCTTSR